MVALIRFKMEYTIDQFKYLDAKTIELAAISASMAGGCHSCLDYHFNKALEIGCTIDQVKEAIELGKMIKQRSIKGINERAEKLIEKS